MAGKRRAEVTEKDVSGFKYFDKLAPLLERLHDDGCQRDTAGSRTCSIQNVSRKSSPNWAPS